ncbi:YeeE/YedE family protein [Cognatiyoonia sp. IB215182]|uniref:YeeE/YedE family protein n=1 Tax=Cognatiyoonia sp. IB215182 TaxID=3097353 RepID=UPI002A13012B|nr:YeeE/YedE thiosulfate transporter family protein [Cognatiyoonia sp. IB215182]MDX8354487.1 YeeE/YedE thiosulfate transporter family protein [Cognatiyoonia sp. IB215182]
MQNDWIMGLLGGGLIGLAGALLLLVNGRIMGASGIIGGLVDGSGRHDWTERVAFLAGLALLPGLAALMTGGAATHLTENWITIVIAGLLVGVGTRLANGCTSGHGVCGISRLSPRGIVASIVYILAGAVTVLIFKHLLGAI